MKITTLNIQAAGLSRAKQLAAWLSGRDDDVLILTETSGGQGTGYLLDQCRSAGWSVLAPNCDGDRGCALLSRLPMRPATSIIKGVTLPGRCVIGQLETMPAVTVVGVYVPSNDRTPQRAVRKRVFLSSLGESLTSLAPDVRAGLILGGDYNLITRDHQPAYPGVFAQSDYAFLDALTGIGLVDAHRHLHPGDQPHSWVGHRGHGYRYDYLHGASAFTSLLTSSAYLHEVRDARLSDHAAVSIGLAIETSHLTRAVNSELVGADTLF